MRLTIFLTCILIATSGLVVRANDAQPSEAARSGEKKIAEAVFARLDADGDGMLNPAEFEKGFQAAALAGAALIKALDANGDGQLGPSELIPAGAALAALDDNSDGNVSTAEMTKAAAMDSFDRQALRLSLPIMRADRDGDHHLSLAETPGRMKRNFRAIDQDGDQAISWGELKHRFGSLLRRGVNLEVVPQSAQGTSLHARERAITPPRNRAAS